jgi:cell division protease FtsH
MSVRVVKNDDRREPELAQIEEQLEGFFGKVVGAWKFFLVVGVVAVLLFFFGAQVISSYGQYLLYGAYMLFQLLFAILFMIVQFVALFWFLGRPRTYWIMPGETGVGFKDYKGNPEVLEVARRIVTLLRGVKEFNQMGGDITRGVLLIGPPGTGKSYLAQCISTEAGVPFGYLSAPSIQGMFMGMDVMRVWGLFNKANKLAKKYGACILFLDEIDAIGRSRGGAAGGMGMGAMGGMFGGGGTGGLNELLNQMDPLPRYTFKAKMLRKLGFKVAKSQRQAVLTMAATNIAEVLDQALLRPGRFDRKIVVDYPDFDGRKEIIEYYLAKVSHEELDLDQFGNDTIGYSPVAIKHVINEAVINAHFNGRQRINYLDIERAMEVHEWGLRQPLKSQTIEERRVIAYHEVGHTIAQFYLAPQTDEPFSKVTLIRHGRAEALSAIRPTHERHVHLKDYYLAHIQISLASRGAEELFCETASTGVGGDFPAALYYASVYLSTGMNGSLQSNLMVMLMNGQIPSDPASKREVDKILREQMREVKNLLIEHHDEVVAVAETLLDRMEMDAEEVEAVIREVRRRQPADGTHMLRFPGLNAPVKSLDFGVLPPPRDDFPRYPAKPKPQIPSGLAAYKERSSAYKELPPPPAEGSPN